MNPAGALSSLEEIFQELPLHDCEGRVAECRTNPSFFAQMETQVGSSVAPILKSIYCKYDMSSLAFADVSFGAPGRYTYLEQCNAISDKYLLGWWGEGERPKNYYCVAFGEYEVIIVNAMSGLVYYADAQERQVKELAQDLEDFLIFFSNLLWRKKRLPELDNSKINTSADGGRDFWNRFGWNETFV